jgi:hypothetical protein
MVTIVIDMTTMLLKSSGSRDPGYNLDVYWICFNVIKKNIEIEGPSGDLDPKK